MLNTILHHVGMSSIICSKEEIKYEIDESNNPDEWKKGPWYNTSIYSRLHGGLFEYFITHARTDRYNILCSLTAYDKKQPDYEDEEMSIGDSNIRIRITGSTLNFIGIWIKLLDHNYEVICEIYNKAMKDMFNQIPTKMTKPLSPKQKV